MSTFSDYIRTLHGSLKQLGQSSSLHLTAGNETCDLDSVCCTLGYAHFIAMTKGNAPRQGDEENFVSLPLLQCQRKDFTLNREAVHSFMQVGIDAYDCLFLDDLTSEVLSNVGKLSITLVDHNFPLGFIEPFKSNVIEVIDHHKREIGSVLEYEAVKSTVEEVGSCSTLVAEKLLNDSEYIVDEVLATLFLSAIHLDTENLKSEGRTSDKDKHVSEQLLQVVPSTFDLNEHYRKIFHARFNISDLTTLQVLNKDFKLACVNNKYSIGFCSLTALLSKFLVRPHLMEDLLQFYSDRKLDTLLLIGVYVSDVEVKLQKQIAIFQPKCEHTSIPSPDLAESLASVLEANEELGCERLQGSLGEFDGIVLDQKNIDMSRKQIIPIISQFVSSMEADSKAQDIEITSRDKCSEIQDASAAVLGVPNQQQHSIPLEPTITVITTPLASSSVSQVTGSVHMGYKGSDSIEGDAPAHIPEYSMEEESREKRLHRFVSVGGEETTISMDLVQPYRKIIQHAGYVGENRQALVIISACYLPPHSLPNYTQVIHHVFFYVLSVLDKLVVDDYRIVYLHSGAPRNSMPSVVIFHKFYQMIDRRLRKQLMHLYVVHPTFWVKTMLRLARPFISTKFWRKLQFIPTLQELAPHVAVDDHYIPAPVAAVDKIIMSRRPSQQKYAVGGGLKTGEGKHAVGDAKKETKLVEGSKMQSNSSVEEKKI